MNVNFNIIGNARLGRLMHGCLLALQQVRRVNVAFHQGCQLAEVVATQYGILPTVHGWQSEKHSEQ